MKKLISLALLGIMVLTLFTGCKSSTGTNDGFNSSSDIVVVTREEGSGTRGAFIELTGIEEKTNDGSKTDRTSKEAITQMKTDTILTTVAGDNTSIGYVSMGSLNDTVKAINIEGISPTSENVKNASYKISRPFNIAIKRQTSQISGLSQDFISFIMSKEGQDVISENYIEVDDSAPPYSGNKPSGKIVIAGSSSVTPVMEKLREAYLLVNPDAEIEIQQSDSSSGMKAAIDGTVDIGMSSRELKDSEKDKLKDIAIALDGIAVITHNENTIDNLTIDDVKSIFIGDVIKWNEIIK